MKVEFSKVIKQLSGKPIVEEGKDVILTTVACNALLSGFPDEQALPGEEKVKRFVLAEKIFKGATEFTAEEVALVKKLIGKAYTPLVVGRAFEILDPPVAEVK